MPDVLEVCRLPEPLIFPKLTIDFLHISELFPIFAVSNKKFKIMSKLRFKNEQNEWVEVEIRPHHRIEVIDDDDNRYEIKPDKFGGIEVQAADGRIVIEPHVSNEITIKTI